MNRRGRTPATPSPMAMWMAGFEAARLGLEAQAVIGMRVMGMAGLWAMPPSEAAKMVAEKQAAFARAGMDAARALATGKHPLDAMRRAMAPLRHETSSNIARLSKHAK